MLTETCRIRPGSCSIQTRSRIPSTELLSCANYRFFSQYGRCTYFQFVIDCTRRLYNGRIQLFDASRTKHGRVFDLFHKSLSSSLRYTPVWCGSRVLNFDGTAKVSPLLPRLAWVRTSDTSPGSPLRIVTGYQCDNFVPCWLVVCHID